MAKSKKAGRGSDQFMVRLPDGMRDQIREYAETSGRSMNAEVVAVLQEAFPAPPAIDDVVYEIQRILRSGGDFAKPGPRIKLLSSLEALQDLLLQQHNVEKEDIAITLERDLFQAIKLYARATDLSINSAASMIIRDYLGASEDARRALHFSRSQASMTDAERRAFEEIEAPGPPRDEPGE